MRYLVRSGSVINFIEDKSDFSFPTSVRLSLPNTQLSGSFIFPSPTGGITPHDTTFDASLSYDSAGLYDAEVSGSFPNYYISGLTVGSSYIVAQKAEDSNGNAAYCNAMISVDPGPSSLTFPSYPEIQLLSAGTRSGLIGTWGAPPGTNTYTLVETTGGGLTLSGSGVGPWYFSGASNNRVYNFLMSATGSGGERGYSNTTVAIQYKTPEWEIIGETDFTDGNWQSFSSTGVTASTTNWQHILYASDGSTVRARVGNNTAQVRNLVVDSTGVSLRTTSGAGSPSVKIVLPELKLEEIDWVNDIVRFEFIFSFEEPVGSASFVKLAAFSKSFGNSAVQHGFRILESGTKVRYERRSWVTSDARISEKTQEFSGLPRYSEVVWEGYIIGGRTVESYAYYGKRSYQTPRTGSYLFHQCVSQTLATSPTITTFGATSVLDSWGVLLYCDGSAVDNDSSTKSRITLIKARCSRLAGGNRL